MSGFIAYEIKGNDLTLWVERITNNSLFTTSGTLSLKLWATEDPYIGGTIEGYILGTYTIGTLQPFHYIKSLKVTTFYDSPPPGAYFVTLTLTEWNGAEDVIIDYYSFSNGLIVPPKIPFFPNVDDDGGTSGCFISTSMY